MSINFIGIFKTMKLFLIRINSHKHTAKIFFYSFLSFSFKVDISTTMRKLIKFYCKFERTVETTIQYLLHCSNFPNERLTLFNKIDDNILSKENSNISKVLLLGDDSFNGVKHIFVLIASIEYILLTKRFEVPLYQN